MEAVPQTTDMNHKPKRWVIWLGWVCTALPVLLMLLSAVMKFMRPPQVVESFTHTFGYPESELAVLGVVEVTSAVLYAIPRTAVLGAILVTGYLGGAIATHARLQDPSFVTPFVLGVLAWAGLYLRDDRLRQFLPLRRTTTS